MTKLFRCLMAILILHLLACGAGVVSAQKSKVRQNASGTWTLDLEKSEFGEAPKPKSATLTVTVKDDNLTWTSDVVGPDGTRTKQFFDGVIDGNEYPVRSEPDVGDIVASYTQDKDGTTHATIITPTGRTHATITVSRDEKTLLIKNELRDNSGTKVTWSEVWNRS
jgi:hypothetical protein